MSHSLMQELEALARRGAPEKSSAPAMLSLSDEELNVIISLARPIEAAMRDPFLRSRAKDLARYQDIGPGLIFRIGKQHQREFFRPPSDGSFISKYGGDDQAPLFLPPAASSAPSLAASPVLPRRCQGKQLSR